MKILIDMNLPPRWAKVFTAESWEALHWSQVGEPTASDREIMAWAREHGYTVFTHDLDFSPCWRLPKEKGPVLSRFERKIFFRKLLGTWLSIL
jgi:predicted nuclease of predicted toxin-antitoxin system